MNNPLEENAFSCNIGAQEVAAVHKKIFFLGLITMLVFVSHVEAFRLEGFEWGASRDSVISKLRQRGWKPRIAEYKQVVEAEAFLLGETCEIRFLFTPSLYLSAIRTTWETPSVGDALQKSLVSRYGSPHVVNPGMKHYEWHGSFKGEEISLDYYESQTIVFFQSGRMS